MATARMPVGADSPISPGVVIVKRTFLDLEHNTAEQNQFGMRRANSDSMLYRLSKVVLESDAETVAEDPQEESAWGSELECTSVSSEEEVGSEEQSFDAISAHSCPVQEHHELDKEEKQASGASAEHSRQMAMAMEALGVNGGWCQMPCYFTLADAAPLGTHEPRFLGHFALADAAAMNDQSCSDPKSEAELEKRPRGRRARAARAVARRAAAAEELAQHAADCEEEVERWMDESQVWHVPVNRHSPTSGPILPDPVKRRNGSTHAGPRTTVMLRNMPNNYNRSMLLELLDSEGFAGQYDFLYLPFDFQSCASLGYCFINLRDEATALRFWQTFDGYSNWILPSRKVSGVSWAGPHQGLRANIKRYRNSPVMAKQVPDEYKPMLFENGVRVPFPVPMRRPSASQAQ